MSDQGDEAQDQEDLFVRISELTVEEGRVTITNPELASALEDFAKKTPDERGVKGLKLSW